MTTPEQIAAGLSEAECAAVLAMESYHDSDTPCRNARDLAQNMGSVWTDDDARHSAHKLVKLELADCERGLVTCDGDFYGSGWLLTETGLAVRAILKEQPQ